ncbi:MAG: anti-sigma F factor [Bacillota bacterium]|jgi:stage II sporulation protein AB (anti-sigma F factor)
MESKMNWARVEFESVAENLGFARVAAASWAAGLGFTLEELEDIKLAVSEAVSNCIVHAYPERPGRVLMQLSASDQTLVVSVQDEGVGIEDVQAARRAGVTSSSQRMGMGFTLMEALSESMEVASLPGQGTTVVMSFVPGDR